MIGGFIPPDRGSITIGGTDVTGAPPERRPTAMVFQSYALWPHMTVFDNVAFGLKIRRLKKADIRLQVERVLSLVNLSHHTTSYPARISGGEQQRVALARALVLEPEVLLLDEPLSNLDAKLRVRVREDIRELQQRLSITTIFVTHDQDEALSISDRIAVMNGGRIEQYADQHSIYSAPRTRFVADFVGAMNTFDGIGRADGIELSDGVVLPCDRPVTATDGVTEIGVRPEDVRLGSGGPIGEVRREIPRGHFKELLIEVAGVTLRAYVEGDFHADRVEVGLRRALVYRGDQLVDPDAPGPRE